MTVCDLVIDYHHISKAKLNPHAFLFQPSPKPSAAAAECSLARAESTFYERVKAVR